MKDPVQIDYMKACYVMEQARISTILLKIRLNHFMALPEIHQKTRRFTFSGAIEREKCHETG